MGTGEGVSPLLPGGAGTPGLKGHRPKGLQTSLPPSPLSPRRTLRCSAQDKERQKQGQGEGEGEGRVSALGPLACLIPSLQAPQASPVPEGPAAAM